MVGNRTNPLPPRAPVYALVLAVKAKPLRGAPAGAALTAPGERRPARPPSTGLARSFPGAWPCPLPLFPGTSYCRGRLNANRGYGIIRQLTIQLLDHADAVRRQVAPSLTRKRKSALGQFITPSPVARFMASLFPPATLQTCRLLDAGAGVGALSCAFLERCASPEGPDFKSAEIEAYEIDNTLRAHLETTLASYAGRLPVTYKISSDDFICDAARKSFQGLRLFSHAILNPPYKKINSASEHRLILRRVGIETVNLYSAFVALSLALMQPGGQLVAIIPRSFCNGPYYRPFREFLSIARPFGICTCSGLEPRRSRTTTCCRKTSSSGLSATAARAK
jgi:predicted RNA methylase